MLPASPAQVKLAVMIFCCRAGPQASAGVSRRRASKSAQGKPAEKPRPLTRGFREPRLPHSPVTTGRRGVLAERDTGVLALLYARFELLDSLLDDDLGHVRDHFPGDLPNDPLGELLDHARSEAVEVRFGKASVRARD